jgi:L-lactate permease
MLNNTQNGWRPLITKVGIVSLLAFAIAFFAWPVNAEVFKLDSQWTCGKTEELAAGLKAAGEDVIAAGSIDGVVMFSLWANSKTRTFTAVGTPIADPKTSCIIIHGDKLSILAPKTTV